MITAHKTESFKTPIETVWKFVTDLNQYAWRSDIDKISVQNSGKKFIEYTKSGYPTEFTITSFEPFTRYEFDMKNKNINGHWTGIFCETDDHGTTIDFTEQVVVKNVLMRIFAGRYLKKQQQTYMSDLKKVLGESNDNQK